MMAPPLFRFRSAAAGGALLGAALLFAPATGMAQGAGAESVDPRLQPWIGCWRTMDAGIGLEELGDERQPTRACVVPSTTVTGSVDIVLFARDRQLSRSAIPRPGTSQARTVDECEGTESSMWTPDESRLVLKAEFSCARGVKRVETGLMAMNGAGQLVQFQHLQVGRNEATTVARFRFESDTAMPAGLHAGAVRSTRALRLAAGSPVTTGDVRALATRVPASLTEAWLAELGQQFTLDARTLVALADGGVPPRVIDVMVALAHPERFQLAPAGGAPANASQYAGAAARGGRNGIVALDTRSVGRGADRCGIIDDFCYGPAGFGAWGLGWRYGLYEGWGGMGMGGMGPWGMMSPWGLRNGGMFGPLGMNAWGPGFGPWGGNGVFYGGGPVVIIPSGPGTGAGTGNGLVRGRAVNGGGYTRPVTPAGAGPAGASTRSSPPASSGGSSDGGSAGSSSGGRTAKPRPPGGR
jgi:hypothetical protein